MAQITVNIGGGTELVDLSEELEIVNADAERHTTASKVAWWGVLAASATGHAAKLVNAAAKLHNALVKEALEHDPKVSEWKAKALAGADEFYNQLLDAAADAKTEADKAHVVHWTFIRKMDMLREMIKGEQGTQRSTADVGRIPGPDNRFEAYRRGRKSGDNQE